MAFTIPDKGEGLNDVQAILFQEHLEILAAGVSGVDCVLSGCAVTAQGAPDMTVAVASGVVLSNSARFAVTGANGVITAAHASNPRLDLVVITSAGAIAVRAGTAAAEPKPAARTANDVVIAVVYIPATDTTIATNQITDMRMLRTDLAATLQTIWVPAGAMTARTTNGAAVGSTELATNKNMLRTLDFDSATQEFAQFDVAMPKSWDEGTVTAQPLWTAASGSGGVVFAVQGIATSNDDPLDVAFGTEQTSTDTFLLANDCHVGPVTAAITVGGTPAENDRVQFQVKRNVADAADTMAVDAKLIGVRIFYSTNNYTDA